MQYINVGARVWPDTFEIKSKSAKAPTAEELLYVSIRAWEAIGKKQAPEKLFKKSEHRIWFVYKAWDEQGRPSVVDCYSACTDRAEPTTSKSRKRTKAAADQSTTQGSSKQPSVSFANQTPQTNVRQPPLTPSTISSAPHSSSGPGTHSQPPAAPERVKPPTTATNSTQNNGVLNSATVQATAMMQSILGVTGGSDLPNSSQVGTTAGPVAKPKGAAAPSTTPKSPPTTRLEPTFTPSLPSAPTYNKLSSGRCNEIIQKTRGFIDSLHEYAVEKNLNPVEVTRYAFSGDLKSAETNSWRGFLLLSGMARQGCKLYTFHALQPEIDNNISNCVG